ncbi:LD-carboxypeptidase [Oceanobacillus sp. Castelsardo]|uniref:S66 peptidase family protein n=1 Tax=Oceanobacillus sp. Castelsardo TaxID=1851204 RepID=UPI000837E9CE|nr:LD-carboxypeptidase [Oceanobacillus sp. Castelsardo]
MIFPSRLCEGDTIGIIAPAGPVDLEDIKKGIPFFENLGLCVQLGQHVDNVYGYLAGTDKERLEDFHDMVVDPNIKAIIFARGGYGTARFVPSINYEWVRRNPKIIWGYSDITYLHTAIRQQTGLVTFHGPMVASDIAKPHFDYFSATMFNQLFQPTCLIYSEYLSPLCAHYPGETAGQLVGGNLSLLISTLGTPFEIDTKDKILVIEDIGEEPYRVDSMLNQLKLSGKLREARGIVIGDFANAESKLNHSLTIEEVFHDYFSNIGIPVMGGFKIGHCYPHFAVPLGAYAKLSTYNKQLVIDPGVK